MEHFYDKIDGWFDFQSVYMKAIEEAPSDRSSLFVEIGTWLGKSAAFMGVEIVNSKKDIYFYVVDNWSGSPGEAKEIKGLTAMMSWMKDTNTNADGAFDTFNRNIAPVKEALKGHFNIVRKESSEASTLFKDESIDFLFLDGDHSYEAVIRDIDIWLPKVKKGGVFAGHDRDYPPAGKAIFEKIPENIPMPPRSYWYTKGIVCPSQSND